jgi:hypothetical protein
MGGRGAEEGRVYNPEGRRIWCIDPHWVLVRDEPEATPPPPARMSINAIGRAVVEGLDEKGLEVVGIQHGSSLHDPNEMWVRARLCRVSGPAPLPLPLPCPVCGSRTCVREGVSNVQHHPEHRQVLCELDGSCGYRGPYGKDDNEAIERHNAFCKRLR